MQRSFRTFIITIVWKKSDLSPTRHHFYQLIVSERHSKVMHAGVNTTLTALRENYWILEGKQFVKKFISHCIVCIKYSGKPFQRPPKPSLPFERVDESAPLTNTGVDLAGPLFVVNNQSKDTEKCTYVCMHVPRPELFIWIYSKIILQKHF